MDCLDLLAVQGTLKSLLQHHSSKAPILLCSAFFIVQLSHPYMTTGKTMALTRLAKRLELAHSRLGSPLLILGVEWHALPCWLAPSIWASSDLWPFLAHSDLWPLLAHCQPVKHRWQECALCCYTLALPCELFPTLPPRQAKPGEGRDRPVQRCRIVNLTHSYLRSMIGFPSSCPALTSSIARESLRASPGPVGTQPLLVLRVWSGKGNRSCGLCGSTSTFPRMGYVFWPCLELPGASLPALGPQERPVKGEKTWMGNKSSSQISDDLLRRFEAPRGWMLCI